MTNNTFNGAAVLNAGDKLVIFTNDDLSSDEVEHLQMLMAEHVPEAEVIIVVGITGVVVSRSEQSEEEEAL